VQAARKQGRHIFAFTRPGDRASQDFALRLGGASIGAQGRSRRLHRDPHERYPSFPYRSLWQERKIVSVANLTRQDGIEFLALAAKNKIETQTKTYPLDQANGALADLRAGRLEGAAVLIPPP
jgi:alcohol dehydrogenase, propanol-preferring